jgi:sodium transport system permease protein
MLVTLVSFVLTFIDFLPHGKFMYGIPFFGSMLSVFDSVKGNVDIQNTLLAVMMNLFTAAIGITLAKKNFQQEQVLFRN